MRVVRRYVNDSLDIFPRRAFPSGCLSQQLKDRLSSPRFRLLTVQN